MSSCFCVGCQNGEPFCPCVMKAKGVYRINSGWVIPDTVIQDDQPCLWDAMPETFPGSGMKIGHLSCSCPKCTPRC